MMVLWGMLPQFSYTKMLVVDDDTDARNWDDVAWARSTRMAWVIFVVMMPSLTEKEHDPGARHHG